MSDYRSDTIALITAAIVILLSAAWLAADALIRAHRALEGD